jgi:hypothetical protein
MLRSTKSARKLSVATRSIGILAGLVGLLLVCLSPAFAQTPPVFFNAPMSFGAGSAPQSVAVGDFNGDGKLDMAVADYDGGVSVLLGNGDGTFQTAVSYAPGPNRYRVAVGDFNGDGHLDLAIVSWEIPSGGTVSVLLGNGDGTFQAAVNYQAGAAPFSMAVGDFNGDGHLDLLVTDAGHTLSNLGGLFLFSGNGDGTFQTSESFQVSQPWSVAAGDFNGDGKLDLAVTDFSGNVTVLLGNGDGTFQVAATYALGVVRYTIAVGDLNGDGKPDLVIASAGGGVSVLLGNGDGTFQPPVNYAGSLGGGSVSNQISIAFADFNGDGHPDLAATNSSGGVNILLGNGDGTFQSPVSYAANLGPSSIALGDFNGDGVPDLALPVLPTSVSVLLNATSPSGSPKVRLNNTNKPVPAFGKSSLSAPMTVAPGGTNTVAFATVWVDEGSGAPGTTFNVTASYGGQPMTSAGPVSYDYNYAPISTQVFYLVNPPTGTNILKVNATSSSGTIQEVVANLVSFNGVDQTTPVRPGTYHTQHSVNGVTDGIFTATIGSQLNDLILGAIEATYTFATPASNQTVDGTANDYFMVGSDHSTTTGAFSVTDTWSFKNPWAFCAYAGFSIQAATTNGGGGGTPTLTYTATPVSRVYGTNNPTFTGTVTGFIGTDTMANATTGTLGFVSPAGNGSAVGSYAINGTGLTAIGGKYVFAQAPSNATALTIMKATPTVTVTGGTFGYDGNPHGATAKAVGFDGTTPVSGTFSFTYNPGGSTVPTTPGTYSVTATFTSSDSNYSNASGTGSIVITGAGAATAVTLNYRNPPVAAFHQSQLIAPMTVTFGGNTVAFVTVWVDEASGAPGTTFNVTATYGGQPMTSAGPAAYDYNYAPISSQVFYLVSPPATSPSGTNNLIVTATASAGTIQEIAANLVAYDNVDLTNPVRPGTYQTLHSANGVTVGSFTANIASNPSDFTLGAVEATYRFATPASNQTVDATAPEYFQIGSDHATTGAFSVADTWGFANPWAFYAYVGFSIQANSGGYQPTLTYTATPVSRTYGSPNPAFTGTVTGFIGTDTQLNATTGTLAFTTTATSTSSVGSYLIKGSGLTANASKYLFTQNPSNATALTITKATPTLIVSGGTFAYDGNSHEAQVSAVGVDGHTTLSGSYDVIYSTSNGGGPLFPGTYSFTCNFTSGDPNYTNASVTGSITITGSVSSGVTLNNKNPIVAAFGSSTLSALMTVTPGGTNTVAFATVWVDEAAGSSLATFNVTATYGGQPMTSAGFTAYNYSYAPISAQVFYLVNPPRGSNTLTVSATASSGTIQEVVANLVSFNNVSQTAPVRPGSYITVNNGTIPSGSFTATISSNANDLTLGAVEQSFHFATPASNQTVDGTASAGFAVGSDHSTIGAASISDTWSFTQPYAFFAYAGFSIQAAP